MNQELRSYQVKGESDINAGWANGHKNILYVLPTGGGKTFMFSNIARKFKGEIVIIAHRETLVSQISLSLANLGVRHRILAPNRVIREISLDHAKKFNNSFVDPIATVTVGGVDTMVRRIEKPEFQKWASKVKLWIQDECHHCLKKNKWGRVLTKFHNAIGLGVTATPTRMDGRGLNRDTDGVFDLMIQGPTMVELIKQKYLVPYKIYCPPSDFDASNVKINAKGELNQKQLNDVTMGSTITGDVVLQYLKYARGLRGLTFCPSVESAEVVTEKYNLAGVRAKLITANSENRKSTIQELTNGTIKQIVSVDVLGEGVDVPSVEVCSFLRKTESLSLYMQQFGRGMRLSQGKNHIIILDHVQNVKRHNLPDVNRSWTMDRRSKKSRIESTEKIKICSECLQPFNYLYDSCPHCGVHHHSGGGASTPKEVDGDLTLLSDDAINQMKAEIDAVDFPPLPGYHHDPFLRRAIINRQNEKIRVQLLLRERISQWAGNKKYFGMSDSDIHKSFYTMTGKNILEAQTLPKRQAIEIMEIIE